MTRTFVDVEVLSTRPEGEWIEDRLELLKRLRHGAGVVVLTSEEGAWFWSLASKEVKIRVVPDGHEFSKRVETVAEWALRAVGFNTATTGQLLRRKTPLPVGDWRYDNWLVAEGLRQSMEDGGGVEPLIEEEFRVEQWSVAHAIEFLENTDEFVALDYEWDIATAEPIGLAIGTGTIAAYVPLQAVDFVSDAESRRSLVSAVDRYLRAGKPSAMHGGRADLGTQFRSPIDLTGVGPDDTMVMAYLCGEPVLALKDLARKYLHRDPVDFPGNLSDLPVALGTRYAAADARNTYDLFAVLGRTMAERQQWGIYTEYEKPLVPIIAEMEQQGVPLDLEEVRRLYLDTVKIEQGVRYAILDHYGLDVAKDSGKTLETNEARRFVLVATGIDPGGVDQRVLTLMPQGEIDLLLLHRRSRTLRRNFLGRALRYYYAATHPGHERHLFKARKRFTAKGELTDLGKFLEWKRQWEALGDPEQFRYFPRFNQAGAMDGENRAAPRSGRLSSSAPNFQQQSRKIRSIYVAPPGCKWWSWDYSGLELHIAAALSQDPEMLRVLTAKCDAPPCQHKPKCGDLHAVLQYKVLEITGKLMDRADVVKPFNFEQLYGGGAKKGVEIVAKGRRYITVDTARDIINAHHILFAGFWAWRENMVMVHRQRGYAETLFGRRRYIPEYWSRDPDRQAYADRAGVNHIIQGTAADIVKKAMILVVPILKRYGAHMCAQVHDELCGWVPDHVDLEAFGREIGEAMTSIILPGITLKVEGSVGANWGMTH